MKILFVDELRRVRLFRHPHESIAHLQEVVIAEESAHDEIFESKGKLCDGRHGIKKGRLVGLKRGGKRKLGNTVE